MNSSSNDAASAAIKRALAAAILSLGALGGLAVGQANAMPGPAPLTPSIPIPPPSPAESGSGSQASDVSPVNDIKIGNRSQLSESAGEPAPPNQQTSSAGRPQTLVFKIGRFVIGR